MQYRMHARMACDNAIPECEAYRLRTYPQSTILANVRDMKPPHCFDVKDCAFAIVYVE